MIITTYFNLYNIYNRQYLEEVETLKIKDKESDNQIFGARRSAQLRDYLKDVRADIAYEKSREKRERDLLYRKK